MCFLRGRAIILGRVWHFCGMRNIINYIPIPGATFVFILLARPTVDSCGLSRRLTCWLAQVQSTHLWIVGVPTFSQFRSARFSSNPIQLHLRVQLLSWLSIRTLHYLLGCRAHKFWLVSGRKLTNYLVITRIMQSESIYLNAFLI